MSGARARRQVEWLPRRLKAASIADIANEDDATARVCRPSDTMRTVSTLNEYCGQVTSHVKGVVEMRTE